MLTDSLLSDNGDRYGSSYPLPPENDPFRFGDGYLAEKTGL